MSLCGIPRDFLYVLDLISRNQARWNGEYVLFPRTTSKTIRKAISSALVPDKIKDSRDPDYFNYRVYPKVQNPDHYLNEAEAIRKNARL